MSTFQEKIEAIKHAMESTQKRIDRLEYLKKSRGILEPSESHELDMCYDLMKRGRELLRIPERDNNGIGIMDDNGYK